MVLLIPLSYFMPNNSIFCHLHEMIEHEGNTYFIEDRFCGLKLCKSRDESFVVPKCIIMNQKMKIITKIMSGAFRQSSSKIITFENDSSVNVISNEAFLNSRVEEIKFPASLRFIQGRSFVRRHMKPFVCISVPERCEFFAETGNGDIYQKKTMYLVQGSLKHNHRYFNIRESTTFIFSHAFYCHPTIYSIHFPSSLERIESCAFWYCINLKRVYFSKNSKLKTIHEFAFSGSSIKYFECPKSVETICCKAFHNCEMLEKFIFEKGSNISELQFSIISYAIIKEIKLPLSLVTIHELAFDHCDNLVSIIIDKNSKISINNFNKLFNKQVTVYYDE